MAIRVIVAEGSPSARRAVELALSGPEFEVRLFDDGIAAARAISEETPDALVVGLALPGKDGYEVAGVLRSRESGRQSALVFLRGGFESPDLGRIAPIEYDGIVRKPFDSEALAGLVRGAVAKRKEIQTLPEEPAVADQPSPDLLPEDPETAEIADTAAVPAAVPADESRIRDVVREEIEKGRPDFEAKVREIAAAEFKRLLVEELKEIED